MTLHEAIIKALTGGNSDPMSVSDITKKIIEFNLYQKKDGSPLQEEQVFARIRKYPQLFSLEGDKVRYLELSPYGRGYNYSTFLYLNKWHSGGGRDSSLVLTALLYYAAISQKGVGKSSISFQYGIKSTELLKERVTDYFSDYILKFNAEVLDVVIKAIQNVDEKVFIDLFKQLEQYEFDPQYIPFDKLGSDVNKFWSEQVDVNNSMGEFSSPAILRSFISSLIISNDFKTVYDPAIGTGSLLLTNESISGAVFGQEIDKTMAAIAYFNLKLNGFNTVNINCNDSILHPFLGVESSDLIISSLPFGKSESNLLGSYKIIGTSSFSIVNNLMQVVITTLAKDGQAIIHVPEGFLISTNRADVELRKYLLSNDLIDAIVLLPSGVLWPYTGIRTALISIIKKSKKVPGEIYLINTEDFIKPGKLTRITFDDNVFKAIRNKEVIELCSTFTFSEYLLLSNNQSINVRGSIVDLEVISDLVIDKESSLVELGLLVSEANFQTVHSNPNNYPIIKVSNLCNGLEDYPFELRVPENEFKFTSGKLVTESALLVAKIGNDLKATYFNYSEVVGNSAESPIIVDNNILVLQPSIRVMNQFVVLELQKEYVKRQVQAINRGTTIPHRTKADILSIKIAFSAEPNYQFRKIDEAKKDYAKLLNDRHKWERERWGLYQDDILPHLQHTYSQIFSSLRGQIVNIENFLSNKIQSNSPLEWHDRMSGRTDAISLQDTFQFVKSKISDATKLVDTLKRVFEEGDVSLESVSIIELIRNVFEEFSIDTSSKHLHFIKPQSFKTEVDREQFVVLLRNIFSNAFKHGFDSDKEGNVVFEVYLDEEEKFVVIRYFNDGRPLPDGITFEKMLQYGKRSSQDGYGLGGYIMERIVRNHNGIIREIPGEVIPLRVNDNKVIYSKFKFEILIPYIHD